MGSEPQAGLQAVSPGGSDAQDQEAQEARILSMPATTSMSPLRTAPRLASRSALCGRALSTRTCTSPHHQPAAAAGSPLSKGKSTSSTVTTVIMLTADTLLAYAVGPPSLGKRKPTSTLSGRGMLLKPGPADQRPKNHKTRHFQVPAVTAHRSGQQPWSWESAQPWRLEAWA